MDGNRNHFLKVEGRGRVPERNFNYVSVQFCERRLTPSGGRQYTQADALRLSVQCFQAIHDLHALGFVHRNLKPSVFCLRSSENGEMRMYLTSFWYAYRFRKRDGSESRSPKLLSKMKKSKFLPRSYHLSKEITRVDDLESWIYIVVSLMEPSCLNWDDSMPDMTMLNLKERFFCLDCKFASVFSVESDAKHFSADCEPFDSLPKNIHAIVKYLHKLDDRPNYPFLGMLLAEMIRKAGCPINGPFDFQSNKYAEPKAVQMVTVCFKWLFSTM